MGNLKNLVGLVLGGLVLCSSLALPLSAFAQSEGAQASDADAGERALTAEELLTRDPQREDYVQDVRCIDTRRIRRTEVLDERHVSVKIRRDEYYLIQFDNRCPGLRRGKPIMMESRSSRLCVHDAIRAIYDLGLRSEPGMRCHIPGFEPVTYEQILQLKDTLQAERRKKREETS